MQLASNNEEKEFRLRARDWLRANKPRYPRPETSGPALREYDTSWQQTQFDGGWAGVGWPKEMGGLGLSITHQLIWQEEYALCGAPPPGCMFVALNHAGPTLIAKGTDEQRAHYLPRILRGEHVWCQGFSEPGAGSDLASLRMRAVRDRDDLVVNGSKIWTTLAQTADVQELLVRTDNSAGKHHGITWIICDMKSPGITIRPLTTIAGDGHFCEVFYEDVRIPVTNVVGEIDKGWSVAMSTLAFERGTGLIPFQMEMLRKMEALLNLARNRPEGSPAISRGDIAARIAECRAEVASIRAMVYMSISRGTRQSVPGSEGTLAALRHAELHRKVEALALDVIGPEYLEVDGEFSEWSKDYLNALRFTIAGGTSEIRRNIIAQRVLNMPRSQ